MTYHFGLKTKITILVSVLVIVLLSAVAYLTFSFFGQQLKTIIANDQFLMLSTLSHEIDQKLRVAHRQIVIGSRDVPPDALRDGQKAQQWLDSRTDLLAFFDNHIFLLTPTGRLIAESPYLPNRRGLDLSFRPYFQNTIATRGPVISDPYITTQQSKHPVIMMTAPIFDKTGKIAGLLTGSLDLMGNNLLGDISRIKNGNTGYLYLTTADRTMIMHPDKDRIFKSVPPGVNQRYDEAVAGKEGSGETINSYGLPMIASFKRLETNNWILASNYPVAEAHKPLYESQKKYFVAAATGIILIFVSTFYLMKRLTDPLVAFTRHISVLPQKTGADKLLHIDTQDEIGTLSRAFNQMIQELDRQKEALQESEAKYRIIADNNYDWEFWIGPEEEFLYASPSCKRITGYSAEEFLADPQLLLRIIVPEYREQFKDHRSAERHSPSAHVQEMQFAILRRDGVLRWIGHVCQPVYDDQGQFIGTRGSNRDITERIQAEQEKKALALQLNQAQKMEAVGQLAGGIAHDFNNILTAVLGYSRILQGRLETSDPRRMYIDYILTASQRAAGLTKSLLAFSRKQIMESKPHDINEIVREITKILPQLLTEQIELKILPAEEEMIIMADLTQVDQVVLNLATNARDAMPRGGKLSITTRRATIDEAFIRTHGYGTPGDCAVLSVSDSGTGMTDEVKARIFEPFFTTKETGKGTGLGLSIVYGIIKQHNGFINVYTEPGTGTTFHVYFPVVRAKIMEELFTPGEPPKGTETILVVEDNPESRNLIREVLESNGYTVITAVDGEDAQRKYDEFQGRINFLLCDVIMPKKNGMETYSEIAKKTPGIPVLFMSGYTGDIILDKGVREDGFNFISKPFSPNEMLIRVRSLLDTTQ